MDGSRFTDTQTDAAIPAVSDAAKVLDVHVSDRDYQGRLDKLQVAGDRGRWR